jgi:hypothetical protein
LNPFVNPNKRDFLLPKGCKDLADVLPQSKQLNSPEPKIHSEEKKGTIANVQEHVRWLVEATQTYRSLTIISPKEDHVSDG